MNNLHLERLVPDHVKRFEAYIPSKPDDVLMRLYRVDHLHRLNNNENPLGPPPAARRVIEEFPAGRASIYPSGDVYHLRHALADCFGLHPDQFLLGNGANEVISFVIKAFCQEGDNIVTADRTFSVYEWVAEFSGYEARLVPLKDFAFDAQGMLDRIDDRTKILFICNPNNPTGTYFDRKTLDYFLEQVAGRQIVVLDEAYAEFVENDDYPNGLAMLDRHPNLVVFRTFSKMYALAGLRIGYLAGSREVVDVIRRTCVVYSVNTLAQAAALAAMGDLDHIRRTREMVRQGKNYVKSEMEKLGLTTVGATGNYLMIKLPISDSLVYRKLMTRGVMIRTMTGFRFPNWIRVTISHMEALTAFVQALTEVLKEHQ